MRTSAALRVKNKLFKASSSLAFRAISTGFIPAYLFLVSLVANHDHFGQLFLALNSAAILTAIFDLINTKYAIQLLGENKANFTPILRQKLQLAPLPILATPLFIWHFNFSIEVALLTCFLGSVIFISSSLLTYFYCVSETGTELIYSLLVSTLTCCIIYFLQAPSSPTTPNAILWALIFQATLAGSLFVFLSREVPVKKIGVLGTTLKSSLTLFPRRSFYWQNLLSIFSGRISTIILPTLLTTTEIGKFGAITSLLGIYIFLLSFIGLEFFKKISSHGIDVTLIRSQSKKILLCLFIFCVLAYLVIELRHPNLKTLYPLVVISAILISATSHQGYLLFHAKLDQWVVRLSLITLATSALFYGTLTKQYGIEGTMLALIFTELVSLILVGLIFKNWLKKNTLKQ